jgi:MFS family permease
VRHGYLDLIREHRLARGLWLAQLASQIGDWIGLIALFQLGRRLGGDVSSIGVVLVVQQVPVVVWGPLAGVVADRFDRRSVMIAADLSRAMIALAFPLVARAGSVIGLYAVAACLYSASAFFEPAKQALQQAAVPEDRLVAANALSGATYGITGGLGSLIGGLIVEGAGEHVAFIVESALFLVSALLVSRLRGVALQPPAITRPGGERRETLRGFLANHPRARAALCVKLLGAGLSGGGMWVVVVVYGQTTFPIGDGGAISVGILNGAMFFGALIGPSFVTALFRGERDDDRRLLRGITGFFLVRAILLAALAASPSLSWAAASALGLVIAACGSVVTSTILLQRLSPDHMRGRLFALDLAIWTIGVAVSAQLSGVAMASWKISPQHVAYALGVVTLAATAGWISIAARWRR